MDASSEVLEKKAEEATSTVVAKRGGCRFYDGHRDGSGKYMTRLDGALMCSQGRCENAGVGVAIEGELPVLHPCKIGYDLVGSQD